MLCVLTVASTAFARTRPAPILAFIPAFAGATGTADALAAILLLCLYRMDGSRALLFAGAAYAINALLIVPYTLMFPGVIDARGFIGNEQSSAWLWLIWHLSFPILLALGSAAASQPVPASERLRTGSVTFTLCATFAALATVLVTAGRDALPPVVHHGAFTSVFGCLALTAAAVNFAAVVVLLRTRPLSAFSLWASVALSAAMLDTALNAIAPERFTVPWYVGKAETFVSASSVLAALLATWSALYARSSELAEQLDDTRAAGRQLHTRLRREHAITAALQRASLPESLPTADGLMLRATYRSAVSDLTIGGDWYDAFVLADGRLAITIGDVAGHGLGASIVMGKIRHSLRVAASLFPDPNMMLSVADSVLRREYPDTIATAFVGLLQTETGELCWASAGHPPPMIRRPDGAVDELNGAGPPLGIYDARLVPAAVYTLEPASLFVAYTDGLVESDKDLVAGLARLRAALSAGRHAEAENPALALFDTIVTADARDDVALITVTDRRLGTAPATRNDLGPGMSAPSH